ncbi:hypothetical protein PV327_001078 [Microctonus hyperodae]|uniref:DUF155 domain-containing protein n=1 Tax=Microctonus hyperodae TaxID=165561 RepID=A0AA39G7H0_MICHY|nr:hypothetical protein PV327_001078 [Microctonus hyperodae]
MIFCCIKNIVVNKSRVFGVDMIRNFATIISGEAKFSLLSNGNIKHNLRIVSHVLSQRNLHEKSVQLKASDSTILNPQLKKRPLRKKKLISDEETSLSGFFSVKAMATAEEYNLENLLKGLVSQDLYVPKTIHTTGKSVPDVIHAVPKYEVSHETREMYFFREGTVVMWNTSDLESGNILSFLKNYEDNSYTSSLVHDESEMMSYTYAEAGRKSYLKDGDIYLACNAVSLDKYAFSNALSQSVKLSIWEASLDQYIDSIEFVTEDLKAGKKIKMTREQVLRKQGELLALRHVINLSSDLLDTPDFYWEKDDLENLYHQTCGYFSISKRTRVMNEKINHCVELVELLSSHLSDRHHIRLEWMIIILIIAEVVFEIIHFVDRYLNKCEDHNLSYVNFSSDMKY